MTEKLDTNFMHEKQKLEELMHEVAKMTKIINSNSEAMSKITEEIKTVRAHIKEIDDNHEKKSLKIIEDFSGLFECIEENETHIAQLLEKRSKIGKELNIMETEKKIVESHEVMTDEFRLLKNETERSAARRLASEDERKKIAELQAELSDIDMNITSHRDKRNLMISAISAKNHILAFHTAVIARRR